MKKRILFITGTRADFGKLKPLISGLDKIDDFEVHLFVTGMHMLKRHGYTYLEVYKCGFQNINVFLFQNHVSNYSTEMDLILASTIQGLGNYIREFRPDMIVVHGDRVEALAGAIVGSINNILTAHIEGGELSGTVDELIRHSVSKLSHLHFVANEEAFKRLVQMGENPDSIYEIGSPDIDIMLSNELPEFEETADRYKIPFDDYNILIYHPVTTEIKKIKKNISEVIEAVIKSDKNYIVIEPNNDTGSDVILEAYEELRDNPKFRIFPSIRFEHFLTLLKNAECIIGNSSVGIREAPVYGIPTINIGTRQNKRFKHSSIVDVNEDSHKIINALNSIPENIEQSLYFGQGNSADLFIKNLLNPILWDTSYQKGFIDIPDNVGMENYNGINAAKAV